MKYKMLVTDMDDTLLNDDLTISKENEEAIKKAIELGVRVILCSGRATTSMAKYVKQLNLDKKGKYGISYNGSIIFDTSSLRPVYEENISKEDAKFLFSFGKDNNLYVQTYQNDDFIVEKRSRYSDIYSSITGMEAKEVGDLIEWINDGVIKVLFQGENDKLLKVTEQLKPIIKGKLHMFFSKPTYLEFTNINANKGLTVKRLREEFGFSKDEVICIGDNFNDLYMIKEAGVGVAVANAQEKVREYADYVTKSTNNEHAIKEVIEKFIL
ncbi:MAG: HAD family phosphatase [Epulopiscium sp.]|mgnify:FL=1|jgi:Cof subfamily protein (haloacid dehalogenase superfamily)|nr:HAD family phosphatase [Candidatus Epulonipiscium sp.]